MRIAEVTAHGLEADLSQPFAWSCSSTAKRSACLVEIVGEDGTAGWGECFGPAELNAAAIGAFRPHLLGADAPIEADAGMVVVPEAVGLDIAIDRGALERFGKTPDRW
jgi:D-galactarolactone cycloisomerase